MAEYTEDAESEASLHSKMNEESVPCGSRAMMLHGHDHLLLQASAGASKEIEQIAISGSLAKGDALFNAIMDPKNEDTKQLIREYLHQPMAEIYGKLKQAIGSIDVENVNTAREKIELARALMKFSEETREMALDHVYENMKRQVDSFSTSIDVYNDKMMETFAQALKLYEDRMDTEIRNRAKVLRQKKDEHSFMLDAFKAENNAEHDRSTQRLSLQKQLDEQASEQADKELARQQKRDDQELARQEKKDQQDLARQRKKDEQEHIRAEREIVRKQKIEDAKLARAAREAALEYDKELKQLEANSKKIELTRSERDIIAQEFKVEMSRYTEDMNLAREAMRNAIAKGKSCQITHTAPRIDWGKPPKVPTKVVPGSISWRSSG